MINDVVDQSKIVAGNMTNRCLLNHGWIVVGGCLEDLGSDWDTVVGSQLDYILPAGDGLALGLVNREAGEVSTERGIDVSHLTIHKGLDLLSDFSLIISTAPDNYVLHV